MKLFEAGFSPETVLTHPRHQRAQHVLVQLIEQLRACASPADGFEFQEALLEQLQAVERDRQGFSQAVKRMRKGKAPQPSAPEPESGGDAGNIETWVFEREMCERVARQFRSVGDALAWRVFDFQRRFILTLCRNEWAGPSWGKAGQSAELACVKDVARQPGKFAILHDLTNCLRIGDITVLGDGAPHTVEIKTNARRRDPVQLARINAAAEAVWNAEMMPGDDPRERLHDLEIPLKTHLDLLRSATEKAAVEGVVATELPGRRAMLVMDHHGCIQQGWNEEQFNHELQARYDQALRNAGISGQRALNMHATSLDHVARDPLRVPWAVYPLHPVICARLIGDITVFLVETNGPALAQLVSVAGMEARWVRPPGTADTIRGEVLMEVHGQRRRFVSPAGVGTMHRTLQVQQSELDRYLIELIHPGTWIAGVRHLLEHPQTPGRPWPHYRDEHLTWW